MSPMLSWATKFALRPVLWMATLLHIVWGTALILIPEKVVGITGVVGTTGLALFKGAPEFWGLVMLTSANIALIALVHEWKRYPVNAWTFWAFIPQQALLVASAISVVYFAAEGHYADGTVVAGGTWFIITDQLPKVILAILHPVGLLRMHLPILPESKVDGYVG